MDEHLSNQEIQESIFSSTSCTTFIELQLSLTFEKYFTCRRQDHACKYSKLYRRMESRYILLSLPPEADTHVLQRTLGLQVRIHAQGTITGPRKVVVLADAGRSIAKKTENTWSSLHLGPEA